MKWKHWRKLYRAEAEAYARHLIAQHGKHIFEISLLDEAPGKNLQEKLAYLLHSEQDQIYCRQSRSVLHRMHCIREQEIQRALRWQQKHYPNWK